MSSRMDRSKGYSTDTRRTFSSIERAVAEMSPFQLAELREAFTTFDKDGNGTICVKELEILMNSLGLKPTEGELKELMQDADLDGSGAVDFYEFIALMLHKYDNEQDIIEAFKLFDRDSDGFVTAEDLRAIIKNMSSQLRDSDYDDMVYEYDMDGDKRLNYEEFYMLMTSRD